MTNITIQPFKQVIDRGSQVTDFTNCGKCSHCGGCCSDLLRLSDTEIRRIRDYVDKHNIQEVDHSKLFPESTGAIDLTCPFLRVYDDFHACSIYEVRPKICREFICNMPDKEIDQLQRRYKARYALISMRDTFFTHESL